MRRTSIFLAAIAVLALTAGTALAAITFHSGPTVTFNGATATASFNVSGLGNDPAAAEMTVVGTAETVCHSPGKKGTEAPGQNPAAASGGSGLVPLTRSEKNGRSTVTINATATATAPTAAEAGCPNDSWTVTIGAVTVTSATLTIYQPVGNIIYGPQTFTP